MFRRGGAVAKSADVSHNMKKDVTKLESKREKHVEIVVKLMRLM